MMINRELPLRDELIHLKTLRQYDYFCHLDFKKIDEEQDSFYEDQNGNAIYFKGGVFALDVD